MVAATYTLDSPPLADIGGLLYGYTGLFFRDVGLFSIYNIYRRAPLRIHRALFQRYRALFYI